MREFVLFAGQWPGGETHFLTGPWQLTDSLKQQVACGSSLLEKLLADVQN